MEPATFSERAKLYFRVPITNRPRYFLAHHSYIKVFFYTMAIMLIVAGVVYIGPTLQTVLPVFKDSGFTGFFGVIIGGIVAAVATYDVQRTDRWAKSLSEKKDEIYTPIYNELVDIRNVLASKPHDMYVEFRTQDKFRAGVPVYTLWRSMKVDYRYHSVPDWLKKLLDEHERLLEEYFEVHQSTVVGAMPVLSEFCQEKLGISEAHAQEFASNSNPRVLVIEVASGQESDATGWNMLVRNARERGYEHLDPGDATHCHMLYERIRAMPNVKSMVTLYRQHHILLDYTILQVRYLMDYIRAACEEQSRNV